MADILYIIMEEYKTIEGYSKYEVSNFGNVRNFKTHRILTPKRNSTGFMLVNLYKDYESKSFTIHKLVCETFLEKPIIDKCVIIHIDGNKLNNHVSNLKYGDYRDLRRKMIKPPKVIKTKVIDVKKPEFKCLEIFFD
jgi:hypothetical protein